MAHALGRRVVSVAVRAAAGVFDVSHMGQLRLVGTDAAPAKFSVIATACGLGHLAA